MSYRTIKWSLSFFLFFFILHCNYSQNYNLDTSMNSHWPMPELGLPEYLEPVTDPSFGTTITRITGNVGTVIPNTNGQVWRNIARHGYSVRQPWNADETILYLGRHLTNTGSWGSALFLDGQTYEVIRPTNVPSTNELRWHQSDPNLMYLLSNNSIRTWNFYTSEQQILITFNGYSNTTFGSYTGNFSHDESKVAILATRNSDGKTVGFVVDILNNYKYPDLDLSSADVDFITVSPLGNYLVVNANFGSGYDRTKIFDLEGNQVGPFWSEFGRPSHFDTSIDENGDEVVVGVSKSFPDDGRIIKRRMSDGQVAVLTSGGYASHSSSRSLGRPQWVYTVSSTSTSWQPYLGEILAVKLDGSRVERICHTRTQSLNFNSQPQPCPSPSGTRVIFASDWGQGGLPVQAYVVDFRHLSIEETTITPNQSICQGEEITLTANGGVSYQWSSGQTTASITVSPEETTSYSVEITLDNGDVQTLETTITVNPITQANAGENQNICAGNSVTLTATGGSSYLWSNGATTQSINVSPNQTTTYSVEVSENGCSSVAEVMVSVNAIPTVSAGEDVTIAPGQAVTLTAVGATSYSWSNGETGETITVTPTQTTTYTVIGTSNGCSAEDEVTVFVAGNVAANISGNDTICQGESTTLTASGGDNFLWNTGETSASITVNPNQTTTYSVEVSDNFGNSDTAETIITVNPIPQANAGENQNICAGNSVTLTATVGSSYLWSNGATTQSINVSPNQTTTYSVEVSENGCSSVDEVTVTVNAIPTVNAGNDVTIAPGQAVTLTTFGATSYSWSNGETGESITVSPTQTTTYTVIGTSNGCSAEDEVTVFVAGNVAANISGNNTICQGENTTLTASGGDNFLWNTGETSASITVNPNQTTTYSVEVSDNFGNSDIAEITITVNPIPQANAGENQSICAGDSVTLTATGGSSYLWSNGATTQSINVSPNQTTTYSVEVSENGCSSVDEVTISVTNLPELQISGETTLFYGNITTLTVSGADSYLWSNGNTSNSITVQPEQTTTYEVTGWINGCSSSQSVTVIVENHVEAYAGEDQRICQGYEVTLTASGGSSYLWNTGATTQSITVSPTANSTYTVTVFDGPFQDNDSVNVLVDPNPNVTILNGTEATILVGNFITLSASGANSYQWNNGATQPNIAVSPSATTNYRVTGFINDCSDEKEITVNVVPRVVADAGNDVLICPQETATLTATGGDDYLWSTGETTQTIEVAPEETTLYTVTVFNELDFDEAIVMVIVDQQCQSVVFEEEDLDENMAFLVYPNPVNETMFIQLNNAINVSIIQMFDVAGKLLFTEQIGQENEVYSFQKEVDVRTFQSGLYFVRFVDNDQVITKKILIK